MVSNSNKVIAEGIEMPNYEPINLTKNNCELSDGLISLCSKGPSFITTPNTFDWRRLQIDFDKFKNTLRKISFFSTFEAGSNTNKNTDCLSQLTILCWSNHCGFLQKVTQMRLKHLYPWFKKTFFRAIVEKESYRIYCKMKRKR